MNSSIFNAHSSHHSVNQAYSPEIFLRLALALLLALSFGKVSAQEQLSDSVEINFHVSKWNIDKNLSKNDSVLKAVNVRLTDIFADSSFTLNHVNVIGGASPEGSLAFNKFLSEKRAEAIFNQLDSFPAISGADKSFIFLNRDWEGVLNLAKNDLNIPFRQETISLLEKIVTDKKLSGKEPAGSLHQIKSLHSGIPYRYLLTHIFPRVRASKVVFNYTHSLPPAPLTDTIPVQPEMLEIREEVSTVTDSVIPADYPLCKPFYMDVRTNMLYDALALPNIGVEFYVGKNFSVGANWMYGWWDKNSSHRYWRAYGGELFGRWWFGRAAHQKPLTGHHIGVNAGIVTFDFEWGGKGYMGGRPDHTLWDRCMRVAGVEYGYSLPVSRRINIDFTLALGYMGGKLVKYSPYQDFYKWDSTRNYHYFGPTKVEVSLVWLIGCGNENVKKMK